MKKKKIIVIGGGAAGLIAAGKAALGGSEVLLLEKMHRPARKLRISGKGRGNLTNSASLEQFIEHFGKSGKFLFFSFSKFFNKELITFMNEIGVNTITERGGRVFPLSGSAKEVVDKLVLWCYQCGVKIKTKIQAKDILIKKKQVIGIKTIKTNFFADAIIITTGGASYPGTGSSGDGYKMADNIGHKIIPPRPALVPLITTNKFHKHLKGLSLRNISLKVLFDGQEKLRAFGEMTFSEYGVTGPIILTLSGKIVDALNELKEVILSIDLKPALDNKKLNARLIREFAKPNLLNFEKILFKLLPKQIIPLCIEQTQIPANKKANQISKQERHILIDWLKNVKIPIIKHKPLKEALITRGGISLSEINSQTMESKLIKNLYFAGEILDLDADTGGYNLQAAFSTGWIAGKSAASKE